MGTDRFEIMPDPAHCLLRITLRGHWDVGTVEAYKAGLLDAGRQLRAAGCPRDRLVALVDVRENGAQSQDVIAHYREILGGETYAPRRLATLVSSALLKRQVERIAIVNQRLFTDEADALAWLLAPDDAA